MQLSNIKAGLMVLAKVGATEPTVHHWIALNDPFSHNMNNLIVPARHNEELVVVINVTTLRDKKQFYPLILNSTDHYSITHDSFLEYEESRLMPASNFRNAVNNSKYRTGNKVISYKLSPKTLDKVRNSFLEHPEVDDAQKDFLRAYLSSIITSSPPLITASSI